MKKIVLSIGTLVVVGVVVVGATGAFYGDTETSTGNTFTAGSIELKVDSESHYNGMVCEEVTAGVYQWHPENGTQEPYYPELGSSCEGTWSEADLGAQKFFYFTDMKPGDHGEDTISLHVYDNDAWGKFTITPTRDADNTCTDSEVEAELDMNPPRVCGAENNGEIDDNLYFTGWLDQGSIPGFQNMDENGVPFQTDPLVDPLEGNNILDDSYETVFWNDTLVGNLEHNIKEVLMAEYAAKCTSYNANGHNDYGDCQGLALDGRMVGSTTYYFGLAWDFPLSTGNEAQSDEYTANMTFEVEQYRNNPNPF